MRVQVISTKINDEKKLLEKAALALQLSNPVYVGYSVGIRYDCHDVDGEKKKYWHPLIHPLDAFRLAISLDLFRNPRLFWNIEKVKKENPKYTAEKAYVYAIVILAGELGPKHTSLEESRT